MGIRRKSLCQDGKFCSQMAPALGSLVQALSARGGIAGRIREALFCYLEVASCLAHFRWSETEMEEGKMNIRI
jgi:hypothetical protein